MPVARNTTKASRASSHPAGNLRRGCLVHGDRSGGFFPQGNPWD
jgi:hypothetical protein